MSKKDNLVEKINSNLELNFHFYKDVMWMPKNSYSCYFNINLNNIVDHYDYHDFPSSENLYLTKEDIVNLIYKLQDILDKIDKIENIKS